MRGRGCLFVPMSLTFNLVPMGWTENTPRLQNGCIQRHLVDKCLTFPTPCLCRMLRQALESMNSLTSSSSLGKRKRRHSRRRTASHPPLVAAYVSASPELRAIVLWVLLLECNKLASCNMNWHSSGYACLKPNRYRRKPPKPSSHRSSCTTHVVA